MSKDKERFEDMTSLVNITIRADVREKGLLGVRVLQPLNQANNPQKHENPSSYAAGWSFAVPTMSRITMSPIFRPFSLLSYLLTTSNVIFIQIHNYAKCINIKNKQIVCHDIVLK